MSMRFGFPFKSKKIFHFCSFLTLNHYTLFKVKYIFLKFFITLLLYNKRMRIVKKKVFCCNVKYKNGAVKE